MKNTEELRPTKTKTSIGSILHLLRLAYPLQAINTENMDLESYYESIGLQEINKFVDNKRVEDVYIEFKQAVNINVNPKNRYSDKKNLSKCLSGFANSNGGIVIWGIEAKTKNGVDYASKLKPIDHLKKFLNTLNSLEGQAVTPVITGVRHEMVEMEMDTDQGFIKTFVPKSNDAPHMANYAEKHYYKRSGDSFYQAEHYDIVDMFSRKKSPVLKLDLLDPDIKKTGRDKVRIEVTFGLRNISKVVAKYPYLAITVNQPYAISKFGLNGNGFVGLKRVINNY